jgi:hypothetical protein
MHDVVGVHKVACLEHLPDDLFRLKVLDARVIVSALQLIEDCPIQLLKDQVNAVVLPEHLQQIHDVVVLQLLQDPDFPQSCFPYL